MSDLKHDPHCRRRGGFVELLESSSWRLVTESVCWSRSHSEGSCSTIGANLKTFNFTSRSHSSVTPLDSSSLPVRAPRWRSGQPEVRFKVYYSAEAQDHDSGERELRPPPLRVLLVASYFSLAAATTLQGDQRSRAAD